jgi:hypothetical protein
MAAGIFRSGVENRKEEDGETDERDAAESRGDFRLAGRRSLRHRS